LKGNQDEKMISNNPYTNIQTNPLFWKWSNQ
jgi:hypothetical protein